MCNLSEGVYERGWNAKAVDDARNFIALHVASNEQIAQAVGLPVEKVEELARQTEPAASGRRES